MLQKSICFLFFSLLLYSTGCTNSVKYSGYYSEDNTDLGKVISDTTLFDGNISTLSVSAGMPVKYIVSDKNCVIIEAPRSILEKIGVSQSGKTLSISPKESISIRKLPLPLSISVYASGITLFSVSSGASVKTDEYQLPTLTITASSGADIEFDSIKTTSVTASVSSGAEIELDGNCDSVSFDASSGGEIDADDLVADTGVAVASSGAGIKCKVKSLRKSTSSGGSVKNIY